MNIKENPDIIKKAELLSPKKVNTLSPASEGEEGIRLAYAQSGYSEISDFLTFDETDREILYPSANALGCSFDPHLAKEAGKAIGEDLRSENVSLAIISGPHPKRNPVLCKNAYYYSEDTYHASRMCEGFASGLRQRGIASVLDHMGFDDVSEAPHRYNSIVDKRTLNEIYENGMNTFIRRVKPVGMILPYGKINGTDPNSAESLSAFRTKSGFGGLFFSPHMSENDSVSAIRSGVLPEMTNSPSKTGQEILSALENDELSEEEADAVAGKVSSVIKSAKTLSKTEFLHDKEVNYTVSKNVARECFVLLKNDSILPLEKGEPLNIIGNLAVRPFTQLRGRYMVNAVEKPFVDVVKKFSHSVYVGDYRNTDLYSEKIKDATDTFILFIGNERSSQHEYAVSVSLPEEQISSLRILKEMGKKIIAVITSAAIPAINFADLADAIIYDPLTGEGSAEALCEILYGMVSPSGRLNQSIPYEIEDYPSYKYISGERNIRYAESVLMGYRYFTLNGKKAAFPFGHGLTYSSFEYSSPRCSYMKNDGNVDVAFDVTNTGEVFAKEVVQVYVHDEDKRIFRPGRELRYFEKLSLEAGETKRVNVRLNIRDFMFYDIDKEDFNIYSGRYFIDIASSSEDVRIAIPITILADEKYEDKYSVKQTPSYYPEGGKRLVVANNEYKMINRETSSSEITEDNKIYVRDLMKDASFESVLTSLYEKLKFIRPAKTKEQVALDSQRDETSPGLKEIYA